MYYSFMNIVKFITSVIVVIIGALVVGALVSSAFPLFSSAINSAYKYGFSSTVPMLIGLPAVIIALTLIYQFKK